MLTELKGNETALHSQGAKEKRILTSNLGLFPHFTGEEIGAQRCAYDHIAGQCRCRTGG